MSKEAEGHNAAGALPTSEFYFKARREQCFAYSSCLQAGFNLSRICGFFPPTLAKRQRNNNNCLDLRPRLVCVRALYSVRVCGLFKVGPGSSFF